MRISPPVTKDSALRVYFRNICTQLNGVSESRVAQRHNAQASIPTTGQHKVGDFTPNSSPSELGTAGSKYVIIGWICTAESPLTFKECRCLTGG